jgi:hypothetical protein
MKALLCLIFALPAIAAPRYVTLREGQTLTVKSGEAAEMVTSESVSTSVTFPDRGGAFIFHRNFVWSEKLSDRPLVIAGPATISCLPPNGVDGSFSAFGTWKVTPGSEDPATTLTVAATTNSVTVRLESSTNLVEWSAAATVTLTNVPAATFFRARLAETP